MNTNEDRGLGRRDFLLSAAGLAAVPLLASLVQPAAAQTGASTATRQLPDGASSARWRSPASASASRT